MIYLMTEISAIKLKMEVNSQEMWLNVENCGPGIISTLQYLPDIYERTSHVSLCSIGHECIIRGYVEAVE